MFKDFKGVLLELSPDPGFILLDEEVKRGDNVGEVRYELLVEISETHEG